MRKVFKFIHRYINRTDNKEILSGSMLSMIFKVGGMITGYLFVVLAVRFAGIEQYGVFSLCLALIQITAMVGRLGFDSSIVRNVAQFSKTGQASLIKEVYRKGLGLITVMGLILTVILYLGSPYLAEFVFRKPGMTVPFQISSIGVIGTVFLYYNAGALRGLKKIAYYSSLVNANFAAAAIFLVIIISFFTFEYPLELAYSAGTLVIAGFSFYYWSSFSKYRHTTATQQLNVKELLMVSLPMLSAGSINIINGWTDTLMLGIYSTKEAVGIFHVLLKVAAITNIVLFAVNSISAPQFARLSGEESKQQLQQFVQKSTKLIVFITTPILILIFIGYTPLIRLFGASFNPDEYLMAFVFLCIGQAVNSFCGSGGQLLVMTGYQKINQNITAISFVISIILNVILIPKYGLNGAAFANMTGLVVRNLLYVIYTNLRLQINTVYNPIADMSKLMHRYRLR